MVASMKLLVVEDEHRIASALKKGLEQEAYVVDLAYDGTEGYDLAATTPYDLIILDLMLPGMDGLTFTRKLREEKVQTPILILTARGQVKEKVTGLSAGADDYLAKPFAFEELLARIRALARRPQTMVGNTLAVDGLTLDTVNFRVVRDGKPIKLSGKEYALLEYLMRQAGRVLTKEQIIDHVWDYDADILPNTVEVYIRNLRKKIDLPFPDLSELIHTTRGFGYSIGGTHV